MKGDERGLSLIGLLVALVLLGLLGGGAALGLRSVPGKPAAPRTVIRASLASTCRADAASVGVAQQAFQALSTSGDFAGTSATAGGMRLLVSGGYLRSSPGNGARYTIDTGTNGQVNVTNVRSGATASFEAQPSICDGA